MTANEQLWQRYRADPDPDIRAELISQHVGLVHHVVRQIAANVGDAVPYEDLVGAGMVGLVLAFEAFDLDRGIAFTTYATQRIRGSVLDELRAADPRTRQIRNRARAIQKAERELQRELGRAARPAELAQRLGITVETYWDWSRYAATPVHVALDSPYGGEPRAPALADVIPSEDTPVDEALVADERIEIVKQAIAELPEQQRVVLSLCYFEELTLRQIAEVLHLTESRISQIRTSALKRLREDLLSPELD